MAGEGFTALVAEDEPLIALDTEDMLRELGASDVQIVDEIGEATSRLSGCNYGVVLFDLDLAGVSTAPLVADYVRLGCRAVVVSGTDGRPEGLDGVDVRLLTKPISPAELRGALAETGVTG